MDRAKRHQVWLSGCHGWGREMGSGKNSIKLPLQLQKYIYQKVKRSEANLTRSWWLLILGCDQTLYLIWFFILVCFGYVDMDFSKSGLQFASCGGDLKSPWRWFCEHQKSGSRLSHCAFTSRSAHFLPPGCLHSLDSPICSLYLRSKTKFLSFFPLCSLAIPSVPWPTPSDSPHLPQPHCHRIVAKAVFFLSGICPSCKMRQISPALYLYRESHWNELM